MLADNLIAARRMVSLPNFSWGEFFQLIQSVDDGNIQAVGGLLYKISLFEDFMPPLVFA
jgi:hypothetical protein